MAGYADEEDLHIQLALELSLQLSTAHEPEDCEDFESTEMQLTLLQSYQGTSNASTSISVSNSWTSTIFSYDEEDSMLILTMQENLITGLNEIMIFRTLLVSWSQDDPNKELENTCSLLKDSFNQAASLSALFLDNLSLRMEGSILQENQLEADLQQLKQELAKCQNDLRRCEDDIGDTERRLRRESEALSEAEESLKSAESAKTKTQVGGVLNVALQSAGGLVIGGPIGAAFGLASGTATSLVASSSANGRVVNASEQVESSEKKVSERKDELRRLQSNKDNLDKKIKIYKDKHQKVASETVKLREQQRFHSQLDCKLKCCCQLCTSCFSKSEILNEQTSNFAAGISTITPLALVLADLVKFLQAQESARVLTSLYSLNYPQILDALKSLSTEVREIGDKACNLGIEDYF